MLKSLTSSRSIFKPAQSSRQFWWWVNMMFNRMDYERVKALGYDRCTAEWYVIGRF